MFFFTEVVKIGTPGATSRLSINAECVDCLVQDVKDGRSVTTIWTKDGECVYSIETEEELVEKINSVSIQRAIENLSLKLERFTRDSILVLNSISITAEHIANLR